MYCHLSPHDEVPTNILGLIKAGWLPDTSQCFYAINSHFPKLEYYGKDGFGINLVLKFSKPNADLKKFYIPPYFPSEHIPKVEVLQTLPHARKATEIPIGGSMLVLNKEADPLFH